MNTLDNKKWLEFYTKNPTAFDDFIKFVDEKTTALIAENEQLREALRQTNETLKIAGMDDIGGGIANLIKHNDVLLAARALAQKRS